MADKTTIARPYAKACFDYAKEKDSFESWSDSLHTLALIVSDEQFERLLKHPKFSNEEAVEWVLSIGSSVFDGASCEFIKMLGENHRLAFAPEISVLFEEHLRSYKQTVEATVISAEPVDDSFKERIKAGLKKRLNVHDIKLDCQIDKSLIAGALIKAGDIVIDGSARGRLARLEESLGI